MKSAIWLPTFFALILILTGCTNNPPPVVSSDPLGTGPFDSRGNYVEAWADDPSKWRKPANRSQTNDTPVVAKNEEPPADSNPLAPSKTSTSKPVTIAKVDSSKPKPTAERKPSTEIKPTVVKTSVAKSSVAKTSASKSSTAKSSTAKSKPKSTRCVVKNGDTLSRIASRYGCSTSAIRRANDLSGSTIRPGQTLVIPKH